MFKRILVPLDSSRADERAVSEVERFGPGREIHLLHVIPSVTPPAGPPATSLFTMPNHAVEYLEWIRSRMSPAQGAEIVRGGDPAETILQLAQELDIHLIAMCTHSRGGLARWMLGSVAEQVVLRSPQPVLLMRPGPMASRALFRRILVPVDEQPSSRSVLETVRPLAANVGAEIVLLHVKSALPAQDPDRELQALTDDLKKGGLTAYHQVTWGEPAGEILGGARAWDADLIAMTTPGGSAPEGKLAGSVAAAVIRHGDRPVLLQRALAVPEPSGARTG